MKIKVIYQGNHWTERNVTVAKEDKAALSSSARVKCSKFTVDSLAPRRPTQQPAQRVTLSGVVRSEDLWCRRDIILCSRC